MHPVTGPFNFVWEEPVKVPNRYSKSYVLRTYYRQKRPYTLRLPFTMASARVTHESNVEVSYAGGGYPYWMSDARMQKLYNSAYRSFVQKMKDSQAAWLVTMAERRKTFDMVADRAKRLAEGFDAAASGNLRRLRRYWGSNAGIRWHLRKLGSNVLEYSFGWAPLVGDIVNGVKTLNNGVPPPTIRARQTLQENEYWTEKPNNYTTHLEGREIKRGVSIIAEVAVDSPFLALANQLGLINPALVVFERTPWSFVANYFVNLDDWLGSFTDFVGFAVSNPAVTKYGLAYIHRRTTYTVAGAEPQFRRFELVNVERTTQITRPTLSGRLPWRLSVQRAATSVSLLLQQLR